MSEKHKIYLLALMVVIAALVAYFRFFRESAEKVTAQPTPAETGVQLPSTAGMGTGLSAGTMGIKPLPPADISRNLFAPTGPLPDARTPQSEPAGPQPVEDLKLSGTVIGGDVAMAIINSRFMRQGQEVGGYRIQRIAPDRVFLVSGKTQRVLEVMALEEAVQ